MILELTLAAGIWVSADSYCSTQVSEGVWTACVTKIGEEVSDGITSDIWRYNNVVWAGNPYCIEAGMMPSNPEAFNVGACQPRTLVDSASEPNAPDLMEVK